MSYRPVIIIGAPRSGTNMLRDVLTTLPGFATWPCDEINFVWKHGNITATTDELGVERVRGRTRSFVRRQFAGVAARSGARWVVEKTCANSLRVPYVDRLVPEARYLLLLRDGPDAIASTMNRWRRPEPAGRYYLQKLRFVAPLDLPWVLAQGLIRRTRALAPGAETAWRSWGPVFDELSSAVREGRPLEEICALQWARCVERALTDLPVVAAGRWRAVSYEAFVRAPAEELLGILAFLGATADDGAVGDAVRAVSGGSVGRAHQTLDAAQLERIRPLVEQATEMASRAIRVER